MFESKTTLFANTFEAMLKPMQELENGIPADDVGKKSKKKLKKLIKKMAAKAATEALSETMAELKPSKKEKKKKAAPAIKATSAAKPIANTSAQDEMGIKLNSMVSHLPEEEKDLVKLEVLKKVAAIPVQLITAGIILPDSSESEMAEAVMAEAMASVEEWTKTAIDNLRQPAPVQVVDCKVVESSVSGAGDTAETKPARKVTAERLKQAAEAINSRRNSRRRNNNG